MSTLYVTSAHYRTPAGCPGIEPVVNALKQNRRPRETVPAANPPGPPLQPSESTLRKMTRRFKPRA